MRYKKYRWSVLAGASASLLFLLSGCMVTKDSPAPGCVEHVGFSGAGGCFGKTAIIDLSIEPETECLDITANNCNGGILEIHNDCGEEFILGGETIAPGDLVSLDLVKEGTRYTLVEVSSNFSEYVGRTDERIELTGTLGGQEIVVAFTKTGPLCE